MTIEVRKFSDREQYLHQRYEDFKKEEGAVSRVYTDSKGIPTVGIGYALLVRNRGVFSERPGWVPDMKAAGVAVTEAQVTAAHEMLTEIRDILNGGGSDAVARAQAVINPWQAGEDSAAHNSIGLPLLDETQMETLFNRVVVSYRDILAGKIGESLVEQWDQSWELIALLSLTYNNPGLIGPGLKGALTNGNRAEAWYQIRQNSNGGRSNGIAKRRYFEAYTFGLYNDAGDVSREEGEAVLAMYAQRKTRIDSYETQFSALIPTANRDYGLTSPGVILTLEESLAPARAAVQ